jgi:hypothetical protein
LKSAITVEGSGGDYAGDITGQPDNWNMEGNRLIERGKRKRTSWVNRRRWTWEWD